jgi:hypothetical protein
MREAFLLPLSSSEESWPEIFINAHMACPHSACISYYKFPFHISCAHLCALTVNCSMAAIHHQVERICWVYFNLILSRCLLSYRTTKKCWSISHGLNVEVFSLASRCYVENKRNCFTLWRDNLLDRIKDSTIIKFLFPSSLRKIDKVCCKIIYLPH